jgi:hypothetical protein
MNRILVALLCLVLTSSMVKADDLFSYDKQKVETEFAAIEELEAFVFENQSMSLTSLLSTNNVLVADLNLISDVNGVGYAFEPPLGIPSFLWGCVFGVAGIAIVYFVADDSEETKKAFKGCVVGSLVGIAVYLITFVAIGVGTASTI